MAWKAFAVPRPDTWANALQLSLQWRHHGLIGLRVIRCRQHRSVPLQKGAVICIFLVCRSTQTVPSGPTASNQRDFTWAAQVGCGVSVGVLWGDCLRPVRIVRQ